MNTQVAKMQAPATLITGAGRGIGRALALRLCAEAAAENRPCRLILTARTAGGLAETAAACRVMGAEILTHHFDMTDTGTLRAWLAAADDAMPIGCAILNAGMSDGLSRGEMIEAVSKARRQIDVNLIAPMEVVDILTPRMAARGGGQFVLIGSLAAYAPLPSCSGYAVSKAGLRMYANAVRPLLRRRRIVMTLAMPGFVETDMSRRMKGWQPLRMDAARAASLIVRGMRRRRAEIVFPFALALLCRVLDLMPPVLRDPILARGVRYDVMPEHMDAARGQGADDAT